MNVTPPEARTEISRTPRGFRAPGRLARAALAVGALGAVLLVLAEFAPLFRAAAAAGAGGTAAGGAAGAGIRVRTVMAGSHHGWALLLVGVPALVLAVGVGMGAWRSGSRGGGGVDARGAARPRRSPAGPVRVVFLALIVLGIAAALVAVLVDLPDVSASGLLGSHATGYAQARDAPALGFYLETLGAALLIVAGSVGLSAT